MRTWLLLALSLVAPAPTRAMTARPVSVEGLARASDAVVRARVLARKAFASGDGRRIFTAVTVEVSELWRGSAPRQATVDVPGGEVGDIGQRVPGAPRFDDGEEVVLFLAREGASGAFRVNGLGQGKFHVEGGEARPDLHGVQFIPGDIPPGERRAEPMSVAELEQRVRNAR